MATVGERCSCSQRAWVRHGERYLRICTYHEVTCNCAVNSVFAVRGNYASCPATSLCSHPWIWTELWYKSVPNTMANCINIKPYLETSQDTRYLTQSGQSIKKKKKKKKKKITQKRNTGTCLARDEMLPETALNSWPGSNTASLLSA